MAGQQPASLPYGRYDSGPLPHEEGQRVEYRLSRVEMLVQTRGYRLCWSRAAECPCAPLDRQLDQPDPRCTLCEGTGLLYLRCGQKQELAAERLTSVQQRLMDATGGMMIRGMMSGISMRDTMLDRMGDWRSGQSVVTTIAGNALSYRDRLINLDAQLTYREVVKATIDPSVALPLRYLVNGGVYYVRSLDRELQEGRDWRLHNGQLSLTKSARVKPGTRISLVYQVCPTWVVIDHPHSERMFNARFRDKGSTPTAPEGRPTHLPLQSRVELQFIPHTSQGGQLAA